MVKSALKGCDKRVVEHVAAPVRLPRTGLLAGGPATTGLGVRQIRRRGTFVVLVAGRYVAGSSSRCLAASRRSLSPGCAPLPHGS